MKTLTTQKLIVWSELKYVWVTMLKAFFLSNNKMKSWPLTDLSNATIDFRLPGFFSSFIVKKVTKRHNRTLLVWYAAPVHFLLETNNASLHGIVRNQDKVSCQAHETLVGKKRLHTKWTALHFVVKYEQRFSLLKGANNAHGILMVLSETKSALGITISQLYCLFTVCFLGRHN